MGQILDVGRNCWVVEPVQASGLLIDGLDYYRAFWKAVRLARRRILISGWQFDSDTRLVRGNDARGVDQPVRFLDLLDHLCHHNPELQVRILAWDYNLFYAFERERMQRWLFQRSTSQRLHFEFDHVHAVGASQHQKFIVIDGWLAFAGGMDVCANRWDTRAHLARDRERRGPRQEVYGPYHDIQGFVVGSAVGRLEELFRERWRLVTKEDLPPVTVEEPLPDLPFEPTLELPLRRVGLSRTRGRMLSPPLGALGEVRRLYLDAIERAEHVIYVENQYFTSLAVYRALCARMRARRKSSLEIVIVLPRRAAVKEALALGLRQARVLRSLEQLAGETGHRLGVFYPVSCDEAGEEHATYVHAKVFQVDDRMLSVGSANTTNRSLGLDTELNLAWEAESEPELEALRSVRVSLLSEHCGDTMPKENLEPVEGLVGRLAAFASDRKGRLRRHPMDSVYGEGELLQRLVRSDLAFDPDRAGFEENVWEAMDSGASGPFANGISWLRRWLQEEEIP